jgi:hypothetical protein
MQYKGHIVFEGVIPRPGRIQVSFYNLAGALLGNFSSDELSSGWQRFVVPDASMAGAASAKGPVIVRLILPDGKELKKVLVRM